MIKSNSRCLLFLILVLSSCSQTENRFIETHSKNPGIINKWYSNKLDVTDINAIAEISIEDGNVFILHITVNETDNENKPIVSIHSDNPEIRIDYEESHYTVVIIQNGHYFINGLIKYNYNNKQEEVYYSVEV